MLESGPPRTQLQCTARTMHRQVGYLRMANQSRGRGEPCVRPRRGRALRGRAQGSPLHPSSVTSRRDCAEINVYSPPRGTILARPRIRARTLRYWIELLRLLTIWCYANIKGISDPG